MSDTILPSREVWSSVQVKTEEDQNSPVSLVATSGNERIVISSSAGTSNDSLGDSQDLFAQLYEQAFHQGTESYRVMSPQSTPDFSDVGGYASDRTDFLLTTDSPSFRTRNIASKCQATPKSKVKTRLRDGVSPTRRLNFGGKIKKKPLKATKKSANLLSLENLRSIERSPSHKWDEEERELLCAINRWYCAEDRATELSVFSKIFNEITGLALRPRIIRNQFESHLTVGQISFITIWSYC